MEFYTVNPLTFVLFLTNTPIKYPQEYLVKGSQDGIKVWSQKETIQKTSN